MSDAGAPEAGPRFAWVLNLDAELELARGRAGYNPPLELVRNLERHGESARRLLGPNDVRIDEPPSPSVSSNAPSPSGFTSPAQSERGNGRPPSGVLAGSGWIGRAWCPTPLALSRLRSAGVEPEPHPPLSVLRRVNHRRFACELGGGLFDQRYVESRRELESVLANTAHPWLLKRPLEFAGRGQLRVFGSVDARQWSWIDASLRRDGLVIEPLVEPTLELSLHGFVWRDGRHELGNVCVQEVSGRGVFRSVRRAQPGEVDASESRALSDQAERVARALEEAGYFGPFGVDAYRYGSGKTQGFCALGEINARYTLGFVTGFPRHPSELVL